ncbi:MAG: hypothetical protein JWN00_4719, partial [Actinomycetia bacterium]|nr:hypothetical protein [Actinomycetes bacterium]
MVDGCQGTDPVRVRRAGVVVRGVGYGALGGLVTGVLLVVVVGTFTAFTDGAQGVVVLPFYAMFAAVLGAIVGSVVGLFGGVVFAVAAPCLQRHR